MRTATDPPGLWHPEGDMSRSRQLPPVLDVYLRRRTWGELLWAVLGLPLGVAGFVFTVVTLSVSGGLLITFVGLPLLALTGLVSRWGGQGMRRTAGGLIGTAVPPPPRFRAAPGLFGWLGSCLKDGAAWRARLYLLLKFPLGVLGFVTAVTFYSYGLGGLTYAIWRPFLPCNGDSPDGGCHRGVQLWTDTTMDTLGRVVLVALIGLAALLLAPWVVKLALWPDRVAIRYLLGPTSAADRVAELERSRAVAVDDSAATLRRIERDLHDGAQAKLVALAMNVGRAREKVADGGDPAGAARLLDEAHVTAKQAIAELRDLARGIHPPVLDSGLDAALATLAAHSPIPVELRTDIARRPEPAIETMAYFCAAELLTNAAKHSGAGAITVDARTIGDRLLLRVIDNGRGGAQAGTGTGLSGLTDRIGTVDGTMTVDSPVGGPTLVSVDVPLQAGMGSA